MCMRILQLKILYDKICQFKWKINMKCELPLINTIIEVGHRGMMSWAQLEDKENLGCLIDPNTNQNSDYPERQFIE